MLLTKCEPADIVPASAARRHDHMIRRQCLRSREPNTLELRQVQRRKCCDRCAPESSYSKQQTGHTVREPPFKIRIKGWGRWNKTGF
jgi:hypothetical protein